MFGVVDRLVAEPGSDHAEPHRHGDVGGRSEFAPMAMHREVAMQVPPPLEAVPVAAGATGGD